MLEKVLTLYSLAMGGRGVREIVPHLYGPPGSGKSTVVQQAADLLGVRLHTINVSRISPLDLEGIQMPVDGNSRLKLLPATFWNELEDGDIILWDEFLHGFPEVYRGILDIFTARRVGPYDLPNVFMIAASNTNVLIDDALEDRLHHIAVPPPHTDQLALEVARRITKATGLLQVPTNRRHAAGDSTVLDEMVVEMAVRVPFKPSIMEYIPLKSTFTEKDEPATQGSLSALAVETNTARSTLVGLQTAWLNTIDTFVKPTFTQASLGVTTAEERKYTGLSARKLTGLMRLREITEIPNVENSSLHTVIMMNNQLALQTGRLENFYFDTSATSSGFYARLRARSVEGTSGASSSALADLQELIQLRLDSGELTSEEEDNCITNLTLIGVAL